MQAVSWRLEPVTAVVLGLMLLAISLGGVILAVQRRARRLNLTAASRRLGQVLIRTGLLTAVAIVGFMGVRVYPAAVPSGLRNLLTYAGVLTLPWYVGDGKLALTMLRRELPE